MPEAILTDAELSPARRRRVPPRRQSPASALELPPRTAEDIALGPITAIAECVLGQAGGAWVSEQRARNRARLRYRTGEILRQRGVAIDFEASPAVAIPLIAAAQDEGRDELVDLWARLLATAFDPMGRDRYRRDFVVLAAALEPMDVICLEKLDSGTSKAWRYRRESVAKAVGRSQDRVDLSLANLAKLGLVDLARLDSTDFQSFITPLGREFLAALAGRPD